MTTNHILIDYENVNATNLDLLSQSTHTFKVMIFIGPHQAKIPVELVMQINELKTARYIRVSKIGKNALDFHIAYHIGKLSEKDPGAHLHIVSRDKGFDPLIEHLKDENIKCCRVDDVSDLLPLRGARAQDDKQRIDAILRDLSSRGLSKPRKMKTLVGTIGSVFKGELEEKKIRSLIDKLRKRGHVLVDGEKVTYNLPPPGSG